MSLPPGILLVDKPVGPTSHSVVARVRRLAGLKKVGHAGTLDPFASGLLLLLLGPATRLSEYLLVLEKAYEATARLGIETSTHDLEGDPVREDQGWHSLTERTVKEALREFEGDQLQEPPRFSSKKVRGEAAHRRVRRGEEVILDPVEVTVHQIALLELSLPEVRFRVRCSSGTYVRALARDLGRVLGVGAHLTGLVRTGIGEFQLASAATLEDLEIGEGIRRHLIPPAQALAHFPAVAVSGEEAIRIRQGQSPRVEDRGLAAGEPVRILFDGELLAVGSVVDGRLRPWKVFEHA